MSSNFLQIGKALKIRLQTIPGLQIYAPDELRDSINPVCANILQGAITYHITLDGDVHYTFRIVIIVGRQDAPSALTKLIPFTEVDGDYSVSAAIEGDRKLGGTVADCRIISNSGMGEITWGNTKYLGTEFRGEAWA